MSPGSFADAIATRSTCLYILVGIARELCVAYTASDVLERPRAIVMSNILLTRFSVAVITFTEIIYSSCFHQVSRNVQKVPTVKLKIVSTVKTRRHAKTCPEYVLIYVVCLHLGHMTYAYAWDIPLQHWRHVPDMARVVSSGTPQETCLAKTYEAKEGGEGKDAGSCQQVGVPVCRH